MPKEIVVINDPVEIDEGCGEELNSGGGAFLSDAILKPRIFWMDGFGAGQFHAIGNVDLTDVLTAKMVDNRYNPYGQSEPITILSLPPEYPLPGGFGVRITSNAWQHSQTGGRGGGYLISKISPAGTDLGHWRLVNVPSDNTSRGAGCCLGLDLQNTPLTKPLSIINFSATPFGLETCCFVRINTDYTVSIVNSINIAIDTSVITVPIAGPFTIEAGIYLNTWGNNGVTIVAMPNGFMYVRLYLPTDIDPAGQTLIRKLNIQTSTTNANTIQSIGFGTEARPTALGLGNGLAGIKFDGVVMYDGMGTIKKYLYDTRVGTSFVNGSGVKTQSTVVFGGYTHGVSPRYLNVQAPTMAEPYIAPAYNTFLDTQEDLYTVEPLKSEAVDILALSPFVTKVWWQVLQLSPGADAINEGAQRGANTLSKFVLYDSGVEVDNNLPSVPVNNPFAAQVWLASACGLILEKRPFDQSKWNITTGSNVQIGHKSLNGNQSMVSFVGMDYVYRDRIVVDEEHLPFPPVCDFVYNATANNHTYAVADASTDWDGTVVSSTFDWGDGSGILNAFSGSHTYIPGNYTITHTVTDSDGLTLTKILAIVVPNDLPVANFSFAVNLGDITGQTIDFTDSSTDTDGTIVAWDWDFGDGSAHSALQNPTHVYAAPGTYTVTLKVTDNSGGQDQVSDTVTTPIIIIPDCALSAAFAANTAFVQGDDYNGGNPPLPAYASTAAFQNYYLGGVFREAYDSGFAGVSDGTNYIMDAVNTFNGHKTLKMAFGKPAATTYSGAGWNQVLTDDGDPVETYYTAAPFGPLASWFWLRMKGDSGVMSDAGAITAFTGLGLIEINGKNFEVAVMNRQGRIKVDISHCLAFHGAFSTDTFDVVADTSLLGDGQMHDLLVLVEGDNPATTLHVRMWLGVACAMSGVSPLLDQTLTARSHSVAGDTYGLAISGPVQSWFDPVFTPSGALKYINVAGWMTVPLATEANPAGVALV